MPFSFEYICFDCSSQIVSMEVQVSALKEDLEKEHQRWRTAQTNYERQVAFGYFMMHTQNFLKMMHNLRLDY